MGTPEEAFEKNLSHIRHELRSPLNAILGYTEMLIEEMEDRGQDDLIPDLQRIRVSGKQLLALISTLLNPQKEAMDTQVESNSPPEAKPDISDLDLTRLVLSTSLMMRLKDAAENYSITNFKKCVDELETLGEAEKSLAAHLRTLVKAYDMEAISALLKDIRSG